MFQVLMIHVADDSGVEYVYAYLFMHSNERSINVRYHVNDAYCVPSTEKNKTKVFSIMISVVMYCMHECLPPSYIR